MPLKMDGSVIEGRNSDRDNCNIVIVSLNKEKIRGCIDTGNKV